MNCYKLSEISIGEFVKVIELDCKGLVRRRMMDLGLVPNTIIEVVRVSPLGDPVSYNIKGAQIALRKEEADQIIVSREV